MICPACSSANPDDVRFCLHCGQYQGELDDERTVFRAPNSGHGRPATTIFADHQPPPSQPADYEPPRERRWMVWLAFAFLSLLALVGVGLIAGVFIQQSGGGAAVNLPTPNAARVVVAPTPTPTPKPTIDRGLALQEVMEAEQKIADAFRNGDQNAFRELLANEFQNVSPTGRVDGKVSFVENARPVAVTIYFENASILRMQGAAITITLTKIYHVPNRRPGKTYDTDSFVWREGRWQMTYSQSSYRP